jgi:putative acetyltransferase
MIRKWQNKDLSPLLTLWLESTTFAHPFIAEKYWLTAKCWCAKSTCPSPMGLGRRRKPQGFISVMETQFVGALFVA